MTALSAGNSQFCDHFCWFTITWTMKAIVSWVLKFLVLSKPARVPSPTLFSVKFELTSPIYKISIMRSENINLLRLFSFWCFFPISNFVPRPCTWTHICIDYWQSNELGNRKTHWYIVHTVLSDHQQDQISLICFTI